MVVRSHQARHATGTRLLVTWILLGLSLTCWVLFLYPYVIYPRVLRLFGKEPVRPRSVQLSVSLLFCAHNEIACLPAKLKNLRELKRSCPDLQILVYDDASSDGSYEFLISADDLLTVVRGPGRTGKAAGMKQLAERATGEILLFTDANILISADAIDRLLPYYGDPRVGGISCTIKSQQRQRSATSQVGSRYLALDEKLQHLESCTGNVMGASGGLFSIRRELYPEFPDTVQDDFTVSMSAIFQGRRLIKALDVIGYENTVERRAEEASRKVRIGARAFHTHMTLRPQLAKMSARDKMKYFSRKLLRWFGGVFFALGTIFGLAAIATLSPVLAALLAASALVLVAISFRSETGLLAKMSDAVLAVFATLLGVLQAMRGRTVATWSPAKSR
jgi:cellulose synthase/poly-beta-1,6-N-acetylglucosamine synthase-like glycosyltransferase